MTKSNLYIKLLAKKEIGPAAAARKNSGLPGFGAANFNSGVLPEEDNDENERTNGISLISFAFAFDSL